MEELVELRPVTVLNKYLAHSGLNRHRSERGSCEMVGLYERLDESSGEWRDVFISLAVGSEVEDVMREGYMETVRLIRSDFDRGLGDDCRKLGALVMVMYGDAQLVASSPDRPRRDDLDPRYVAAEGWGDVRSRLVHLITPEGFATESILFPPAFVDAEPLVDVSEYYSAEPVERIAVGPIPGITPLLSMVFGIALLLGMAVEEGTEPTIGALGRMAGRFASGDEENMADEVMRLLGMFADTVDEERERLGGVADEIRRMLDGE
jgi:hypothetical protein